MFERFRSWFARPAIVRAENIMPVAGINRRAFIGGAVALVASPAIVQIQNIMPVHAVADEVLKSGVLPSGALYAELASVVRRAFVPRLFVQVYAASPVLGLLAQLEQERGREALAR